MQTLLEPVSANSIKTAAALLQAGEIVAIPTETVYGLAANAFSNSAVAKIFTAKGRPQDNPLISHISSLEMLDGLVRDVPKSAYALADAFWPGPLTLVLKRGARVCDAVCAGLDTASVRFPGHAAARDIISACGVPLAAPSANLSGSPSPTTAQDVLSDMSGRIPLIVDGGACSVGVESTVLSLADGQPTLLRPGFITKEQLEKVLGAPVAVAHAVLQPLSAGETAASPGMKYKHYAPKAAITLVHGTAEAYREYVRAHMEDGVFALCFSDESASLPCPCVTYGQAEDAESQAQQLFSALRELDARGARIAYAHCPAQSGVALAVYNRLLRAAAFHAIEV